mmetsp:Transcript_12495/g.52567  ORF Transcript_12495/g.52567 Transcript_12495/m.52567 type:complete len:392 (-) Transcript_12495:656-1831(-)
MAPPAWAELPPPLGAGGATTVAIVAPCGPCVRGALPAALAALAREPFGWRVRTSVQAGARHKGEAPPAGEAAYLAGSDTDRLHALLEAYKDPSVGAIVVAKGGYGSARLLEALDAALDGRAWLSKRLVGFSDATALLALASTRGAVCAHAPMPATDLFLEGSDESRLALRDAVEGGSLAEAFPPLRCRECYRRGAGELGSSTVSGKLVGGNLSLLASLSGTCFAPDYTGAVLVLEDVGEPPYKLDRKLTTLRLAGALRGLAALVLGDFNDAFQGNAAEEKEFWLLHAGLPPHVPVLAGLRMGHTRDQLAVPIGALVEVDVDTLELRCAGVQASNHGTPATAPTAPPARLRPLLRITRRVLACSRGLVPIVAAAAAASAASTMGRPSRATDQ